MNVFFTILFAVATLASSHAAEETIKVGGKVIKIHPPDGMVRCDGVWPEWDRLTAAPMPPESRLIAFFAPPEALEMIKKQQAPELRRYAKIQTAKGLESREIGQKTFSEVYNETKSGIDAGLKGDAIEKAYKAADARRDKAVGEDMDFGISDTKVLGYFDESDKTMLGFTMGMKVNLDGNVSTQLVSAIMTAVNGRLINFSMHSPFGGPADRTWAEKTVSTWKTAVVQANPQIQGPTAPTARSGAYNLGYIFGHAAVYAVIGAILFAWYKKRQA